VESGGHEQVGSANILGGAAFACVPPSAVMAMVAKIRVFFMVFLLFYRLLAHPLKGRGVYKNQIND
jgi:hypothetical protein